MAVTRTARLPQKITGLDLLYLSVAIQYCSGGQINLCIGKVMRMDPRFLSRLQPDPVDTGMGFFHVQNHGAGITFQRCRITRYAVLDADTNNVERRCSDVPHTMDVG